MHATTKARRDEQSLSFLCLRLMLTGEESLQKMKIQSRNYCCAVGSHRIFITK
jgi:hypothetical protein